MIQDNHEAAIIIGVCLLIALLWSLTYSKLFQIARKIDDLDETVSFVKDSLESEKIVDFENDLSKRLEALQRTRFSQIRHFKRSSQ